MFNGYDAKKGAYPWMVSLEAFVDGEWSIGCGGCLIAPDVVLTAVHCPMFFNSMAKMGTVTRVAIRRHGYHDDRGVVFRKIKKIEWPQKNINAGDINDLGNIRDDIALLILDAPVKGVPLAVPAPAKYVPPKSEPWRILGFGQTYAPPGGKISVPKVLQETTVQQVRCKSTNNRIDKRICVINPRNKSGGCPGDSGGPLFVRHNGREVILGVTSGADPTKNHTPRCGDGTVGAWTDVRRYHRWIQGVLQGR